MEVSASVVNPNFVASDTGQRLLARNVLSEKFLEFGLVTRQVEDHLAAEWERKHGRALMRSWEETDDAGYNTYLKRQERIESKQPGPVVKTLDMSDQCARDEIERLMRSPNPKDFEGKINELRGVIGLEPIEFEESYDPAPVIVQEGEVASQQPVKLPPTKKESFLAMNWREQKQVVETEDDTGFLETMRHVKRIVPAVKVAIKNRLLVLAAPRDKE